MDYLEVLYDPDGCCQGKGRTDGKECCGGKQCETEECEEECECC